MRTSVGRPRWMSPSTPSTACWSSDARATSAPPDPRRGWGQCARTPDPCTTLAHVPDDLHFATKPAIAVAMIERALEAGVSFAWVAADSIYGVGEVETALRRAGKGYVLGVAGTHPFRSWGEAPVAGTAEEIARGLPASAWVRLSAGDGTKGPRLHDWAYLELADLEADEVGCPEPGPGTWTRGLLVRRSLSDAGLAHFTTW